MVTNTRAYKLDLTAFAVIVLDYTDQRRKVTVIILVEQTTLLTQLVADLGGTKFIRVLTYLISRLIQSLLSLVRMDTG